jgi:hypothetical protein
MSLPKKGTRSIVVGEVAYRWRVDYDGLHWYEGYLTELSFTIQSARGTGQVLRASIWCSRKQCDPVGEVPFAPSFVRCLILIALAGGWRPLERGLPTFEIGSRCSGDLKALEHGWIFFSRDPQTGGDWLTVTERARGTLEARVQAAIGQALAGRMGTLGKPGGVRLLCDRRPGPEEVRRLEALCASYDLAFCAHPMEQEPAPHALRTRQAKHL